MEIKIPYNFTPRDYQMPMLKALDSGINRIFALHHRRAGKDIVLWNAIIKKAVEQKGLYFYFLPTYTQGKKIIWDGITNDGVRFLDFCPKEIRKSTNATELKIELINGSIIQIIGTDTYDAIRGTNPRGCVFSEYAFQNPQAWEVVKPILRVNGGWAVFNTTPNGKNHAYDMYEMARNDDQWFCEKLTIEDTGVLTLDDIDQERREGMSEEMVQQEYYCLHPNTKILTADLRWIPIKDVEEGVELVGIDEDAKQSTKRKLRRSKVLKKWRTEKKCRKITLSDGTTITASLEHPFLEKQRANKKRLTYEWVETKDLEVGMKIADIGIRPWQTGETRLDGYMAGLYDGEGCLSRTTSQVAQREGDVLNTAREYFNKKSIPCFETKQKGVVTISTSLQSTLRVLGEVRPQRLLANASSVWDGRFPFNGVPALEIVSIEDVGKQTVVGISTSTKTFIAEGLVTHNCSFDIGALGAYYASLVGEAREQDRICAVPYAPGIKVDTFWDLGRNDQTSIGFIQQVGKEIRIIDFYENSGYDIGHYLDIIRDKKYSYGTVYLPHDARQERLEAKKSIEQQVREAGFNVEIVEKAEILTGIQQLRKIFPQLWFDKEKCGHLLRCLENYHKEWDEKAKVFKQNPKHDWSSHSCDMMRYVAMGIRDVVKQTEYDYNTLMKGVL